MARSSVIGQMWGYVKTKKKWFLLPILIMMFMMGALLAFAQGSALAPFIYTIF